jgi:hypothetical protein
MVESELNPYQPPQAGDDEEDENEREPASERLVSQHDRWFVPMSLAKLVVFGVIGGGLYCAFWMYRNWQAYRAAWGYSREPFWRQVHAATGYRISPFWRATLGSGYTLCLFPAVHRECRNNRVRGVAAPVALAFLFQLLIFASLLQPPFVRFLLSPIWVFVPVQFAINRLNRTRQPAFALDPAELLFVVLGGLLRWLY